MKIKNKILLKIKSNVKNFKKYNTRLDYHNLRVGVTLIVLNMYKLLIVNKFKKFDYEAVLISSSLSFNYHKYCFRTTHLLPRIDSRCLLVTFDVSY